MKEKKKPSLARKIINVLGTTGLILLGFILLSSIMNNRTIQADSGSKWDNEKLNILENILENYYKTHTYTLDEFFVCSDMALEVWNLVKTQGINAKICIGNVEQNISKIKNAEPKNDSDFPLFNWLNAMNHAWVTAEAEPFKWIFELTWIPCLRMLYCVYFK